MKRPFWILQKVVKMMGRDEGDSPSLEITIRLAKLNNTSLFWGSTCRAILLWLSGIMNPVPACLILWLLWSTTRTPVCNWGVHRKKRPEWLGRATPDKAWPKIVVKRMQFRCWSKAGWFGRQKTTVFSELLHVSSRKIIILIARFCEECGVSIHGIFYWPDFRFLLLLALKVHFDPENTFVNIFWA